MAGESVKATERIRRGRWGGRCSNRCRAGALCRGACAGWRPRVVRRRAAPAGPSIRRRQARSAAWMCRRIASSSVQSRSPAAELPALHRCGPGAVGLAAFSGRMLKQAATVPANRAIAEWHHCPNVVRPRLIFGASVGATLRGRTATNLPATRYKPTNPVAKTNALSSTFARRLAIYAPRAEMTSPFLKRSRFTSREVKAAFFLFFGTGLSFLAQYGKLAFVVARSPASPTHCLVFAIAVLQRCSIRSIRLRVLFLTDKMGRRRPASK